MENEIKYTQAIKDLTTAFNEQLKSVDKLATNVTDLNNQYAKLPSDYAKTQKQILQVEREAQKANQELQKTIIATERAKQATIRTNNLQTQSTEKLNKAYEREAQKLAQAENLYNKIQSKLNTLSFEYKNLASKKELTNKLTDDEAKRYTFLQSKIQTYDKTLKAVDATMGKYQRNVGNYAGSFNPLTNSINQLTREMPAFTYSVQTGFMALSNNIPIFTDAIGNAIAQNKELTAQGKPTTSVLKQLAGAFFSWQTLLGIGITLLTVYGKEIGDFLGNLFKTSSGFKTLADQQKQLNTALESGAENAKKEIAELDVLYRKTTDVSLSITERKNAVDKLQELYPSYFKNINDEVILNGKAEKMYYAVRDAILSKYMAEAIGVKLQENAQNRFEKEFKIRNDILEIEKEIEKVKTKGSVKIEEGSNRIISKEEQLKELNFNKNQLQKDLIKTQKEALKSDDLLLKMQDEYLKKAKNVIVEKEKETKAVNNLTASKTKQIEKEKELLNFGSVDWVKKQISDIEKLQSSISTTNAEYKSFNDTLEIYKKWLDEIEKGQTTLIGSDKVKAPNTTPTTPDVTNGVKGMNEAFEATDRYKEKLKELEQVALDFAKSFETSFASDAGLTAVFDILGGKLDTFGDNWQAKTILIMEGLQEMYNFLNENSQQYFDAEYDRLEKQKNYALQFAGDSESAKNEIEEQYAERRKKIAKKEAEYKKREALFNIGINTAQAILAVIARGGKLWEGAIVGALGIAQMAKVASAKIPEFWQGTQNAPEGLALVDEKQPEVHTDKKGNIKSLGEKKANYRWLDKGDKIYPSYASYFQSLSSKPSKQNYTQTLSSDDFKNGIDKLLQKDSVVISIDKNGFRNFVNGNNIQNNNVYFKGKIL